MQYTSVQITSQVFAELKAKPNYYIKEVTQLYCVFFTILIGGYKS